jgi:hypothetical protein
MCAAPSSSPTSSYPPASADVKDLVPADFECTVPADVKHVVPADFKHILSRISTMFPSWMIAPAAHLENLLEVNLDSDSLRKSCSLANIVLPCKSQFSKSKIISSLVTHFISQRDLVHKSLQTCYKGDGSLPRYEEVVSSLTMIGLAVPSTATVLLCSGSMTSLFSCMYGMTVFHILHLPDLHSICKDDIAHEWSSQLNIRSLYAKTAPYSDDINRACRLFAPPAKHRSNITKRKDIVIKACHGLQKMLASQSDSDFMHFFSSIGLDLHVYNNLQHRSDMILMVLQELVGKDIVNVIFSSVGERITSMKDIRLSQRQSRWAARHNPLPDIWPLIPSEQTVNTCLNEYRNNTCYTLPAICCVCDRRV